MWIEKEGNEERERERKQVISVTIRLFPVVEVHLERNLSSPFIFSRYTRQKVKK